ncbi:hypothetical protein PbB2_02675 [Candidatus Phycosocius bacilliformis]|uniref:Uncharacterized protein n=1 Tax=Candidatus Phycosocius bacilliformis TaxID=1445552 RepID=A0A2P2ED55_9PROT|nr:hypothetical protein [Candidatus Phycosocius bacilliformis]GBF58984.1 hypothetical protein PbB2_02675 [Candidatus Phycosocius bacilliformis]
MEQKNLYAAILAVSFTCLVPVSPSFAQDGKLRDAQVAVLQAEGPKAALILRGLVESSLPMSKWDQRRTRCGLSRLEGKHSIPQPAFSGDDFADQIVRIYRSYWQQAIDPAKREMSEKWLFDQLRRAIRRPQIKDRDAILEEVSNQLNARNIYNTQGKTAALYDLLLYLREDETPYKVNLPDGTSYDVKVFLLKNMISHGWSRYFNCGGPGTAGFATEQGLYAIAEVYDLESEDFRISFLTHETRHYADYERYPGLEGPELEYRAKLTELALADKTLSGLLDTFSTDQGDDRATPHSFANKQVLNALRRQLKLEATTDLKSIDPTKLREAARLLLLKDNQERDEARGKAPTKP